MRSRVLGVAAVALALALAGCAPTTSAQPSPSASATQSAPTPTPTPTPDVGPTVPVGGDCEQVLTPAQLDVLIGAGWRTKDEAYGTGDWPDAWDVAFQTGGGLECNWVASAEPADRQGSSVDVVVLPADAVPASFATEYAAVRCEPSWDAMVCRVGRVAGDAWVMARSGAPAPERPSEEFLLAALEEVATTVGATFDGRAADRRDAWSTLPGCEALGERIRLQEILGEGYVNGYWEGSLQPEEILFRQTGLSTTCPWHTGTNQIAPDGGFYIVGATLVPGGAWAWDDIVAFEGATAVPVEGAEAAAAFTEEPNYKLFVSDGVNMISLSGAETSVLTAIAERILATVPE